jgi:hypothetical protein
MRKFGRTTKFFMAAIAALMMFAAAPTPSQAANGTVRLHVVSVGAFVGIGSGNGVLYFHHRRYPLQVSGLGIGTVGISAVDLVGTVSNLRHATDIIGPYSNAGAGITFVGGQQAATLTNDRGVVLQLRGPQTGFQIQLSLGGMNIAMQ